MLHNSRYNDQSVTSKSTSIKKTQIFQTFTETQNGMGQEQLG